MKTASSPMITDIVCYHFYKFRQFGIMAAGFAADLNAPRT